MVIINGIKADKNDLQLFYNMFVSGKIFIKYIKVGGIYTNIITN